MNKGVLEFCILFQLYQKEKYGYEILKATKTAFPEVHEATIYSILRRIHAAGYSEIFFTRETLGPERKYYRLTPAGFTRLRESAAEWNRTVRAVASFEIPLSFEP